jgi:NTP pyrophosphatase (non-canonical NTP hydrolase)
MDVKRLQWELAAFVAERGLESRHSPKSLAMALAAEGGALLDLFKWLSDDESRQVDRKDREAAAEALAEIFLHALRLADELGIDVEDAVAKKSVKLAGKAPAAQRAEPPPSPAPSVERQARPPTSRPVPLAGPPSVRPGRHASAIPEFPRVRQPATPPARPPAPPPRPAAAAPAPRPAAPPPPPPPPPEVDRYADLDLGAVTELVKALAKRVDDAQSDDPIARELHDELGTLRRTLYGKTLKPSWVGTSLETVRAKLQEAAREPIGEALKARDYIDQIDRILKG